jgi:hypothetical protein
LFDRAKNKNQRRRKVLEGCFYFTFIMPHLVDEMPLREEGMEMERITLRAFLFSKRIGTIHDIK